MAKWPKKIGLKKHNRKTIFPTFSLNNSLLSFGLVPTMLEDGLLNEITEISNKYKNRCDKSKIPTHVIHGISITTLIGEVGLQAYRFGRQTTIPYSYKTYLPTSPLEVILMNKKHNLHTLLLLDLDPTGMGEKQPQPMTPIIAIDTLNNMTQKLVNEGEPMIEDLLSWDAVLCSNLGTKNQQITYSFLEKLSTL